MADRHTTEKLLEGERLSGKVTLFAKVTILPGDELPYHEIGRASCRERVYLCV